jgi:peptidoglycan hydrolase CwlO-like protein
MRSRRFVLLAVAGLLLPAVVPNGVGAQTEVDRAADEVARAAAEVAEAQRQVDAWAAQRGTILDQVVATLFSLEQTNAQLEDTSFELFDLRQAIFDTEARIRHIRAITETRAVEAYMNGATAGLFPIWSALNFEQSALLEETAASANRADANTLADLAVEKDHLADLHDGYEQTNVRLRELREHITKESHALQELFTATDAQYTLSYVGLRDADAGYQQAVTELEAAQRRRAARAGVEPWRPIVQQYFPEYLVDQALNVMRCESGGNPDAVHPESGATGLFQFIAGTWAFSSVNAGFPSASRYDAEANVAAAAWLVGYSVRTGHPGGAWGHWVCRP